MNFGNILLSYKLSGIAGIILVTFGGWLSFFGYILLAVAYHIISSSLANNYIIFFYILSLISSFAYILLEIYEYNIAFLFAMVSFIFFILANYFVFKETKNVLFIIAPFLRFIPLVGIILEALVFIFAFLILNLKEY